MSGIIRPILKLSGADLPDVFGLVVFARHTPFVFVPLIRKRILFLEKEKCSVIIFVNILFKEKK